MNTFIMMWNPEISNWKMNDFESSLCHFDDAEFNWAIYDYKKAKIGDRFFLVCCGGEKTGIVMSGTISSKPYKGEDWSGKGREVFYVNMDLGSMIHPNHEEIITTEQLEEAYHALCPNCQRIIKTVDDLATYKKTRAPKK